MLATKMPRNSLLQQFQRSLSTDCGTNSYHRIISAPKKEIKQSVDLKKIIKFIETHQLHQDSHYKIRNYREQPMVQLRDCPLCGPHKNDETNLWTLGVFGSGGFNCFRCHSKGDWETFQTIYQIHGPWNVTTEQSGSEPNFVPLQLCSFLCDRYGNVRSDDTDLSSDFDDDNFYVSSSDTFGHKHNNDESEIVSIEYSTIPEAEIRNKINYLQHEKSALLRIQNSRGLSASTLEHYKVGMDFSRLRSGKFMCLTLPQYLVCSEDKFGGLTDAIDLRATKYKYRALQEKEFKQSPSGSPSGVFGLRGMYVNDNGWKPRSDLVVVTEGEFDAMAVYELSRNIEELGECINAVSLPIGSNLNANDMYMQEILKFDNIVVWFDWDEAGHSAVKAMEKIVDEWNTKRSEQYSHRNEKKLIVIQRPDKRDDLAKIKDANDILRLGEQGIKEFKQLWENAGLFNLSKQLE